MLCRIPLDLPVRAVGENPAAVEAQGLSVTGRGWMCMALVVFGAWKPGKAVLGAILFAAFDALQIGLQQTELGVDLPYQLFLALPFIRSILALILMARRAEVPAARMVPYNKGNAECSIF